MSEIHKSKVVPRSPHFHPTIDNDVDTRHIRTLTGGQEQSNVCHFFRSPQTTQKRLTEHVVRPVRTENAIRRECL